MERRFITTQIGRATDEQTAEPPQIEGYASVFHESADLGIYRNH